VVNYDTSLSAKSRGRSGRAGSSRAAAPASRQRCIASIGLPPPTSQSDGGERGASRQLGVCCRRAGGHKASGEEGKEEAALSVQRPFTPTGMTDRAELNRVGPSRPAGRRAQRQGHIQNHGAGGPAPCPKSMAPLRSQGVCYSIHLVRSIHFFYFFYTI